VASFGHCASCGGHHGMCTDHTACLRCKCPPVGWKCPVCGAGLAPTTARCPCVDTPTSGGIQINRDGTTQAVDLGGVIYLDNARIDFQVQD